jgi:hypothetical protein
MARSAHLRQIMACNLAPRRQPDTFVSTNISERAVESANPIRLPGQIWMKTDRHHPARLRSLSVQNIELLADHLLELARGSIEPLIRRLVVDVVTIGH